LLGWVGGVLCAFSWWALPARYGTPSCRPPVVRATLALAAAGVVLPVAVLVLDFSGALPVAGPAARRLAAVGAAPALVAVWVLQPLVALRALSTAGSDGANDGRIFWQLGFTAALLAAVAAVATQISPDPRLGLWMGWFAIWGWAGAIVHGLLRGRAAGASDTRVAALLHLVSLASGAAAIGCGGSGLARVTGALLAATGFHLLLRLFRARVRRGAPH
jgi:hypothetical protein